MEDTNVTELEKDVLQAIVNQNDENPVGHAVYSDCIQYDTKLAKKKQISGVCSSLSRKELAVFDDEGYCWITQKGFDLIKEEVK